MLTRSSASRSAAHAGLGDGGSRTFREFLTTESCYFHAWGWGRGWPDEPPRFLAFRWDNKVQQIHPVSHFEVVPNLQACWADIPETEDSVRPHALYRLGPPLPGTPIPRGKNFQNRHVRGLLHHLLGSATLADAVEKTKAAASG